jgi:hypothetical protein
MRYDRKRAAAGDFGFQTHFKWGGESMLDGEATAGVRPINGRRCREGQPGDFARDGPGLKRTTLDSYWPQGRDGAGGCQLIFPGEKDAQISPIGVC